MQTPTVNLIYSDSEYEDLIIYIKTCSVEPPPPLFNKLKAEIQKDPFVILNYKKEAYDCGELIDEIIKNKTTKELSDEDKQKVIKEHIILSDKVLNFTPKEVIKALPFVDKNERISDIIHPNCFKSPEWTYEQKTEAIYLKPYLCAKHFNDLSFEQIELAISLDCGCLFLKEEWKLNPVLRKLAIVKYPETIFHLSDMNLEEACYGLSVLDSGRYVNKYQRTDYPDFMNKFIEDETFQKILGKKFPELVLRSKMLQRPYSVLMALLILPSHYHTVSITSGNSVEEVISNLHEKIEIIEKIKQVS